MRKLKFAVIIIIFLLPFLFSLFLPALKQEKNPLSTPGPDASFKEYIVSFRYNVTKEEASSCFSSVSSMIRLNDLCDRFALILIPVDKKEHILSSLNKNPLVDYVQPNNSIVSFEQPNDPGFSSQWALYNSGTYYSESGKTVKTKKGIDINAINAWKLYEKSGAGKRPVTIAIIDSGIDLNHPDLQGRFWTNPDEAENDKKDNDNNGYIDDIHGWDFCHNTQLSAYPPDNLEKHGTHCAGIIAASSGNGVGIAGAVGELDVKIMPLKVLENSRSGSHESGSIYNAIKAIKYATSKNADICNISWGIYEYDKALKQAIAESNMLFVTAAGNDGTDNNHKPLYPASYKLPNVISTASVNAKGKLSSFSNYGNKTVDIAAPGESIYSTQVNSYGFMSGSSMAAPYVSAVAAMIYSSSPNLYAKNVKQLLIQTGKPLSSLKNKLKNAKMLDACQALLHLSLLKVDTQKPSLSFTSSFEKDAVMLSLSAKDEGSSGIRVIKYALGKKNISYFANGTQGVTVTSSLKFPVYKQGIYTFYISDYSGNEGIYYYEVRKDISPPTLILQYSEPVKKGSLISISCYDKQSGLKCIKYVKGQPHTWELKRQQPGKKIYIKDGTGRFILPSSDTYTIYAMDYCNNIRFFVIRAD